MQNSLARQIVHFDMTLSSEPKGKLPPMPELAGFLVERIDAGLANKLVEAQRFQIGITHSRYLKKPDGGAALALLFVFADPDAADPANIHLPSRRVRRFEKQDGEARGVSAHAIIDLVSRVDGARVFRVLLESADRLGKTRIKQMLDYQFRVIFKDKAVTMTDEAGDEVKVKPRVGLDAVVSDKLRAGAKGGELKLLKLIDASATQEGFDPPEGVEVRRREMFLKVDVPVGQSIQETLAKVKPWARQEGFGEMYVEWVRPRPVEAAKETMSRQAAERAKIDLAQEDIGETLFARKQFVDLRLPLPDLCTEFSDELLGAMLALMA